MILLHHYYPCVFTHLISFRVRKYAFAFQILRCNATAAGAGCLQKRKNNADNSVDKFRALFIATSALIYT